MIRTIYDGVYTTPTVQISLSATYSTTEQLLDPTEAAPSVPRSNHYHYRHYCYCLTPMQAPY